MRSIWFIAGIAAACFCVAIFAYIIHFYENHISNDPADWGRLGSYIGGTLGAPLSFLGLLALLWTIRIQLSTLKHSQDAFQQQQNYIERKEKKEEWLTIIRDTEEQVQRYLAFPVTRNGVKVSELASLINEVYSRMQKADRLKDRAFADEVMKGLCDGISTATLNGLSALLGSLATYLLKYRALLVEEDKDEIIGHYISSYVHWFSHLQWIGVMLDADAKRLNKLMFPDASESDSP